MEKTRVPDLWRGFSGVVGNLLSQKKLAPDISPNNHLIVSYTEKGTLSL